MRIIFCDSVFDQKQVEPDFEHELNAARQAGFATSLISFEALITGEVAAALRLIPVAEAKTSAIYRGWMLTPAQYVTLYDGLRDKNIELINSPEAYQHCHYLPEWYALLADYTPRSNWMTTGSAIDFEQLHVLAQNFGHAPIIVKDYVKSEKHNWEEACYVPNASDHAQLDRVVSRFLELRGESLNEGIVLREFIQLEALTSHSLSGMPLTKEFRLFFAFGKVLEVANYWEEGDYGLDRPDLSAFYELAEKVNSNFFTMDVAQRTDGAWTIMELGDGQVSGLPEAVDVGQFYQRLSQYSVEPNSRQSIEPNHSQLKN